MCTFFAKVAQKNCDIRFHPRTKVEEIELFEQLPDAEKLRVKNMAVSQIIALFPSEDGLQILNGAETWAILVREHPILSPFGWIVEKMGVPGVRAGSFFNTAGQTLRRLCTRCGRT